MEKESQNKFWSEIPKEAPFNVPEHYFEDFESRLQYRMQTKPATSKPKFIQLFKPMIGLAASFLLVFVLVYYPMKYVFPSLSAENTTTESPVSLESLNEDDFYDMLSEDLHTDSLKQEEIVDYLALEMSDYELNLAMNN